MDDLRRARRVMVFGATGAGTTTLAARLGQTLGLTAVVADDFYWDPDWNRPNRDEQDRRLHAALSGADYVIDSVYCFHNAEALAAVDVVVALDYPRWVSLRRVTRRTIRRLLTREPWGNGNIDTLRTAFGDDSPIRWNVRKWRSKHDRMSRWYADPSTVPVLLLTHPRQAEQLVQDLSGTISRV